MATGDISKIVTPSGAEYNFKDASARASLAQKVTKNDNNDANGLLNALSVGESTPEDSDYYISQYAGGGTTTTTYHRRPVSALWSYIQSKADAIYATSSSLASHISDKTNPHGVTKAQVGLGNVDNTADSAKSVKYAGSAGSVAWDNVSGKPSSYPPSTHTHSYLPLSGGTMGGTAVISWPDSGNLSNRNEGITFPVVRGGLSWSGQSDGVKLFAEETSNDDLELVLQFTDDNSNGLSIRNSVGDTVSRMDAYGNFSGKSAKAGVADSANAVAWTNVTGKPSSYYTLPVASSTTLGGVKVGGNISLSDGTISLTKQNVTSALGYTPPTTDTNYVYYGPTQPTSSTIKIWIDTSTT